MKTKTYSLVKRTSLVDSESFRNQMALLSQREKELEKHLTQTKLYMQVFRLREKGLTLQQIGNEFKITRERVRQIISGYHLESKKQTLIKRLSKLQKDSVKIYDKVEKKLDKLKVKSTLGKYEWQFANKKWKKIYLKDAEKPVTKMNTNILNNHNEYLKSQGRLAYKTDAQIVNEFIEVVKPKKYRGSTGRKMNITDSFREKLMRRGTYNKK